MLNTDLTEHRPGGRGILRHRSEGPACLAERQQVMRPSRQGGLRTSTGGTPGDSRVRRESRKRSPDRLQGMLRSSGLGDKLGFYPRAVEIHSGFQGWR